MLGGKPSKRQLDLIKTISKEFPDNFSWKDLINLLDQIIDRLDINYLNLNPKYLEELVFFYGAKRPDSTIKGNFIDFLIHSRLYNFINIKNNGELTISLNPDLEELYSDKMINPKWQETYNELKEQTKYLEKELLGFKQNLLITPLDPKDLEEVPNFKEKVYQDSPDKSFNGLSNFLEELENDQVYPIEEIDILFDDLEKVRKTVISNNPDLINLENDLKDIRKETNQFRRGTKIPKQIMKPNKQLKLEKQERHLINKLIQNTITGFLLKYNDKYDDLTKLFLESFNEIVTNQDSKDSGRGIELSRFPFDEMGFQMSPRESAIKEINYPENLGKNPDDPDYLRNSVNMVQFSGLEPFSLKPLDNERKEVDWWVERLRNKDKGRYPNQEESNWIYQYY